MVIFKNNRINAFNLKIDCVSQRDTIGAIDENLIHRKSQIQHIVVNSAKIVYSQNDEYLRKAINNSNIINVDGMAVVWALRLLGYKINERVSGIDLFYNLLYLCEKKGYRPFFLGATDEVLSKMINNISLKYPKLKIAGYNNGFWLDLDEKDIISKIEFSNPDMLFIGISSPKKELFLDKYNNKLKIPFSMGVGGSFDILSGRTKRAPLWMQRSGLEWLYRVLQEPKRMWKRYLVTNSKFIILTIREFFK